MKFKWLFWLSVLVVGIFFLYNFFGLEGLRKKVKEKEIELAQLIKEREKLFQKMRLLEDPFYLEKLAREKLGLAKKDEVIYRILP